MEKYEKPIIISQANVRGIFPLAAIGAALTAAAATEAAAAVAAGVGVAVGLAASNSSHGSHDIAITERRLVLQEG